MSKKDNKHSKLINDYDLQKNKQLERLATKMLSDQDKINTLKEKNINPKFLDLF